MLTVTAEAFNRLGTRTQAELLKAVFGQEATRPAAADSFDPEEFDWSEVVDLSPAQIAEFMSTLGEETTAGLKVIAELGPVIEACLLDETGIESYGSFQRSTTRRTRSITGGKSDFLLTWDDWEPKPHGKGRYAVSAVTHRSLKIHFDLI